MTELIIRYLHFAAIICLSGALFTEFNLLAPEISNRRLKQVVKVDAIYGLSALVTLTAGLFLWLWVGKPAEFYSKNPFMHIKLTVFVVMAIFSLFPTSFLWRHRKSDQEVIAVPARIRLFLKIELAMLTLIPIFAVMIARGVGRG